MNSIKKTYITHVTKDYLQVAKNLAKSLSEFSNIPLLVYCIDLNDEETNEFDSFSNVQIRSLDLNLDRFDKTGDYHYSDSGNFWINRSSERIFHILAAKSLAMKEALEEGWDLVCYLDSDCIATPLVDELFEWSNIIEDYPIATAGIHDYMIVIEPNGFQRGNVFAETWPIPDNKLCLEWPLMQFLEISENERGSYRTTGIMLMNQNCKGFINTWSEFCFLLPKLVNLNKYCPFHEETVYNVLSWKKSNKGFPLCYINLRDGMDTVRHFFEEGKEGFYTFMDEENKDYTLNFYQIPEDKRYVKVLHGEKRESVVDEMISYMKGLNKNGYFSK
jgi:hypothetical protein